MHAICDFDGTLVINRVVQGTNYKTETNIALAPEERQKVFTVRPGPTPDSYRIQLTKWMEIVWYDQPRRRHK